jgi:hypothetical protein
MSLFTFLKYRFTLSSKWDVEPAMLLKRFSDVPLSIEGAFLFHYANVLTAGVSYRMDESIGCLLKLKATPQLQLGYAYDYPVSLVSRLSSGSHELMVQYQFRFERTGIKSPRI